MSSNTEVVPFEYFQGHIVTVPVTLNGNIKSMFILDTGAGVNILTKKVAHQIGFRSTSAHTGKRMSGQSVTLPMGKIPSLRFGSIDLRNTLVGVFDGIPPEMNIGGIISLQFFEHQTFTYDYQNRVIILEDEKSLAKRISEGVSVPVRLDRDGPSVTVHLQLVLPNDSVAEVEVDTGSGSLILDDRFRSILKISGGNKALKRVSGLDETKHEYIRYFGKLDGIVKLKGAASIGEENPPVQFQKIIYDGLIGDSFLKRFIVTYDLPNSRMIFSKK